MTLLARGERYVTVSPYVTSEREGGSQRDTWHFSPILNPIFVYAFYGSVTYYLNGTLRWVCCNSCYWYCPQGKWKKYDSVLENNYILTLCNVAVDCVWSQWSQFDECSKSCGSGFMSRFRHIAVYAQNGGSHCTGEISERKQCSTVNCPGSHLAQFFHYEIFIYSKKCFIIVTLQAVLKYLPKFYIIFDHKLWVRLFA